MSGVQSGLCLKPVSSTGADTENLSPLDEPDADDAWPAPQKRKTVAKPYCPLLGTANYAFLIMLYRVGCGADGIDRHILRSWRGPGLDLPQGLPVEPAPSNLHRMLQNPKPCACFLRIAEKILYPVPGTLFSP